MQNMNGNAPMGQMNQGMGGQMVAPQQSGGSKMPWVVLGIVVVVVIVVLGFLFRDKLGIGGKSAEKLSGFQAVFLTNGQVYFGKLSDASSQYATLSDIFYLQVNQPLQQNGQAAATQTSTDPNAQPQLSLVKLGNELHGPADTMKINRDQILFYEDLKSDGKVVQAIDQYKANPNGTGANATGTGTPAQQTPAQQTPPAATPTPTATPKK